jgi:hypothetical protein
VGLVLGALVVSVLFQFIAGNGRFVDRQSAREEVQQNTRAALELIGSELRTVPGGEGIVRAARDSLTIRVPRVWGVVCAIAAENALDLAVAELPGVSYTTNLGSGVAVNLGGVTAPIWSSAMPVSGVSAADPNCNGVPLAGGLERRRLTVASLPQSALATLTIGNVAVLYDQVTYRTGTSAAVPGRWIQRRLGDQPGSSNQPMAGPVSETDGLSFQFFGTAEMPLATPVASAGGRASITRVRVVVESVGRHGRSGQRETKADTILVPLRNRI